MTVQSVSPQGDRGPRRAQNPPATADDCRPARIGDCRPSPDGPSQPLQVPPAPAGGCGSPPFGSFRALPAGPCRSSGPPLATTGHGLLAPACPRPSSWPLLVMAGRHLPVPAVPAPSPYWFLVGLPDFLNSPTVTCWSLRWRLPANVCSSACRSLRTFNCWHSCRGLPATICKNPGKWMPVHVPRVLPSIPKNHQAFSAPKTSPPSRQHCHHRNTQDQCARGPEKTYLIAILDSGIPSDCGNINQTLCSLLPRGSLRTYEAVKAHCRPVAYMVRIRATPSDCSADTEAPGARPRTRGGPAALESLRAPMNVAWEVHRPH
ncbi:hypothetical protein IscW_ISCW003938 [Ixodes scapularis]|uniref:Uncharacterized protein n=1 Tax=Ixodes scapularis TaxID=6945 RepID=B7PIQ6_IXOSC|nr:hypothetical protein IscW_ISCW003938 [Ixodes scapularis]|eukprot:XP_002405805.1 hypothetical protein IscW_ISCW003938 [Ixodes scapularis]